MTPEEARTELDAIAAARKTLDRATAALDEREHEGIAAAWRARVTPTEIAIRVGRSTAHVRKLRPEDVPPARAGGNASAKVRRQREQGAGADQ